jgi:protein-disulfide isomerase
MAASPKKSKKKTSSKAKSPAKKKAVAKKKVIKKRTSAAKKSTVAARKKATTAKRVRKTVAKKSSKKTVNKALNKPDKPRRWWSVLTFGVVAVGIGVAGYLSANPDILDQLQANLVAQLNVNETGDVVADEEADYAGGILVAWEKDGENELKLFDIFRTVFPETALTTVAYDTLEGQQLLIDLGVKEVPAIYYHMDAFEKETLSEVVKDLFTLKNGYYGLNVSLVNPSGQWHIGGALDVEEAVTIGNADAPLTIISYSDPKCQHCRVDAQNNLSKWSGLVDEGMVKIHFMDLPQSTEAHYHAVAMHCVNQLKPAEYMSFRSDLFNKANLSKNYSNRVLKRMGIDYDQDCNEEEVKKTLRKRLKQAEKDGITGVPAVYIHKSEEDLATRITGAKDFSEYQSVMNSLMASDEVMKEQKEVQQKNTEIQGETSPQTEEDVQREEGV